MHKLLTILFVCLLWLTGGDTENDKRSMKQKILKQNTNDKPCCLLFKGIVIMSKAVKETIIYKRDINLNLYPVHSSLCTLGLYGEGDAFYCIEAPISRV